MLTPIPKSLPFFGRISSLPVLLIGCGLMHFSCKSPSTEPAVTELSVESISEKNQTSVAFENLASEEIAFNPKGNQWTVLHFWATWCKPCLAEFPELKRALPSIATDSVQFLLASDEDLDQIETFQKKHQTGLDLIRMKSGVLSDFEIYALPTTIILDKEGKEVFRHAGRLNWAEISSIDDLVAEKP